MQVGNRSVGRLTVFCGFSSREFHGTGFTLVPLGVRIGGIRGRSFGRPVNFLTNVGNIRPITRGFSNSNFSRRVVIVRGFAGGAVSSLVETLGGYNIKQIPLGTIVAPADGS